LREVGDPPEIIDYEIRRELLRANKAAGIARLDHLKANVEYLPLRRRRCSSPQTYGRKPDALATNSDPKGLYIDVILAAQALTLALRCRLHRCDHERRSPHSLRASRSVE